MNGFSIRTNRNPQFNGFSVHLRVLRVSYENTFSAVISSPYLHLLAGLDRRKRIFIRYGEPQAHGNSVVKQDTLPLQGRPSGKVLRPHWVSRLADGTFCRFVSDARGSHECKSASWKYPHVPTSSVRSEGRPRSPADGWQRNAGQHEA